MYSEGGRGGTGIRRVLVIDAHAADLQQVLQQSGTLYDDRVLQQYFSGSWPPSGFLYL